MLIKTKNIRNFLFRNKIYGYLITKNDEYFKSPDNLDLDVLRSLLILQVLWNSYYNYDPKLSICRW